MYLTNRRKSDTMNREIKFRIYSHIDRDFHYFDIYEGYPHGIAGGVSEPQQYTNVKDKYDKEVYDGDVVKIWSDHYINGIRNFELAVVIWEWNKWVLSVSDANPIKRHTRSFPVDEEYIEVVGNILEHPHMVRI
jgi:hypothetical protein